MNELSLPNNRLKLTAPSVHAFCISAGVEILGRVAKKRAPRPAAQPERWADRNLM
jgi:hypothetical protein